MACGVWCGMRCVVCGVWCVMSGVWYNIVESGVVGCNVV